MEKAGVKFVHYLVTAGAFNAVATAQGKKKKNQCAIFTTNPQLTHVHRTGGMGGGGGGVKQQQQKQSSKLNASVYSFEYIRYSKLVLCIRKFNKHVCLTNIWQNRRT